MQYKINKKIIIDKRKLDTVIRLGCPDDILLCLITKGEFKPTGDSLIDENLESMIEEKEFTNWGGNHNPTGKNQYTKKNNNLGQDVGQLVHQVEGQDIGQDVDKDIDKDNNIKELYNNKFEEFWILYPRQRRGNKEKSFKAYYRAIKENRATPEQLTEAVKNYAISDEVKKGFAKGCEAWLNDDRFNNEYKTKQQEWTI